ncbi:MAG TPA: transglycosylase domain-containing protein, partial [Acidimicrobiia bacterium]|nr:transglycosylase domain-containing protein [Acidimicrobiia bacterium]
MWAWTQAHARASWAWLRTDAPVSVRRAAAKLRAVAPSFSLTVLVGGTLLGLLLALLIPTAVLASHVASYQPTSTKLRPLSIRSTVYAADGATLANLGYEDRQPVAYGDISPLIVNAVIAIEDRTFWTNPGVDPAGLVRAATTDLADGAVRQGGSTITEQLVKNRIMNPKGSLKKKVTEAVLAVRLNRRLTKRQIMTDYLNTVYFGEGAYGIQSAAERYFLTVPPGGIFPVPTEPAQVNLAQAALLAGLIANPTAFDPFLHPALAKARRDEVLRRMVDEGDITPAEARYAGASPLPDIPPSSPDLRPRDLWVAQVQSELLADPRLGVTYSDRVQLLLRGGLRVDTTLDPKAQWLAQSAVNEILPNQPPFTAALIAMDPTTGAV